MNFMKKIVTHVQARNFFFSYTITNFIVKLELGKFIRANPYSLNEYLLYTFLIYCLHPENVI